MNMKNIIAIAAVAVAAVAGASTNYAELAVKNGSLTQIVREMSNDPALADPAAFEAALEAVDRAAATGRVSFACQGVSRRCPLTARKALARCAHLSEKARADILARCGADAENRGLDLVPGEEGYANYALQSAAAGAATAANVRNAILNAAIVPVRRKIRAEGGSFVGQDGAKAVKAKLDALAAELNAPRFGKANEILEGLGIEVEWEFIQSRILGDTEVAEIRTRLMDGEIPFDSTLQNRFCVALGVTAYNAFVREYNGESKK